MTLSRHRSSFPLAWRNRLVETFAAARSGRPGPEALFGPLVGHRQSLAQLTSDTEVTFLALGASLQRQAAAGASLVAEGKRLVAPTLCGDTDHDAIGAAVELIRHSLIFVDECADQAHELVVRLDSYHTQTGHLLKAEEQVERILAPLRIIQTLLRIESVVLPPAMQAGFNALSGEIPQFEAEVRQTVGQHAEKLAQTRATIEATAARLREHSTRQRATVAAERTRIADTLAGLERDATHGRERNAHLNGLLGSIGREIEALVVSLQYQDITRQKMEHIGAVLDEINTRLPAARRTRDEGQLAGLTESCRREALQAAAVRHDLDQALTRITSGVGEILGRLAQIEKECWPRAEFKAVGSAVTERVETLQTILREMRELMPAALAAADEAVGVIDRFSAVAANVATTARAMAENMRLIALNAQVLAAQAGHQGAGLLVLAENTYAISDGIRQVTDRISTEFTQADGQLAAVLEQSETLKRHAQECGREFDARSGTVESCLTGHRDETVRVLGQLGVLLDEIAGQSADMLQAAKAKDDFSTILTGLHSQLTAIVQAADSGSAAGPRHRPTAAAADPVARQCTMESERLIHAPAPDETGPASPSPAPELVGAASAYGDNVDLF